MSYEDLVYCCRKLASIHDVYDDLFSMRIHNEANCDAFNKEINFLIRRIKGLCEEELKE